MSIPPGSSSDLPTQIPGEGGLPVPPIPPTFGGAPVGEEDVPGSGKIGPYTIVSLLGQGGMGAVYRAEQVRPIKRAVALKLIKAGHGSRQVIARFEAERQALARLDHPNIARVIDAGTTEAGQPYFVMDLVPGRPITEFCDEHKLSVEARLELFVQVCDAIAHAHSKALIHRDIKPGNVLAFMADGKPAAKVIDFGIAKAIADAEGGASAAATAATAATMGGMAIGTPYAMSPEQAEGMADIDTRTDVYSLGVLLYELLTGRRPFTEKELASAAYSEVLRIIREVEPPRPSVAVADDTVAGERGTSLGRLTKSLRDELEWIPLKAMRKDRERRYDSPLLLAQDIRNYLEGRPLLAGPESKVYLARKFVRRNRAAVTSAGAAMVLIVAAAGVSVRFGVVASKAKTEAMEQRGEAMRQRDDAKVQRDEAERQRGEAMRQRDEAKRQTAISDAIAGFQNDMLSRADPDGTSGDKVTVVEAMTAAAKELDEGRLKDQPLVEASVRGTLGLTLKSLGRFPAAEVNLRRALELRQAAYPEGNHAVASTMVQLAAVLMTMDKGPEAEKLLVAANEMVRRGTPIDEQLLWLTLDMRTWILSLSGRMAEAEVTGREAVRIIRKLHPAGDHLDVATALNNFGDLLNRLEKYDEAEAAIRESIAITRKLMPPGHPSVAYDLHVLGAVLYSQGKLAESEAAYREGLEIRRAKLPTGHAWTGRTRSALAGVLADEGRADEGEALFREDLARFGRELPANHPAVAQCQNDLGLFLANRDRAADAVKAFRAATEAYRRSPDAPVTDRAQALSSLASALKQAGREPEVEAVYREALDAANQANPPDSSTKVVAIRELASFLRMAGRLDEAEKLSRDGLAFATRNFPPDSWAIDGMRGLLALTLRDMGRLAEAEPLMRDAMAQREALFGATDGRTCSAAYWLGEILEAEGKKAEAEAVRKKHRLGDPATRPASRPASGPATQP